MAVLRRSLRETERFASWSSDAWAQQPPPPQRFWHILQTPYRNRVLVMGLIWTLSLLRNRQRDHVLERAGAVSTWTQ